MMIELVAGLLVVSPLVAFGAAGAVGVAMTRRPGRSPAFRAFFLSSLLAALWLGAFALARRAGTPDLAHRWASVGLGVAALLPPAVHRIAATFGEVHGFRRWRSRISWLLALPVVALALGGRIVTSVEVSPWGFRPLYGQPIRAFVAVWILVWILSLYELRGLGHEDVQRKKAVGWLAAAVLAAGLGAIELLPGLGHPVPPLGGLPLLTFVALGSVALRPVDRRIPSEIQEEIATLQDRLTRSERRLTEVRALTRCGDWRWEVGSETVSLSPDLFRILGLGVEVESLRWQSLLRRFDSPGRKALRAGLEGALRDRSSFQTEARVRRPTDGELFLRIQGQVVTDGENTVTAVAGTAQDVTERQVAEGRFEGLLESAPDPMVIVDTEGLITRINGRLEAEFGYTKDELVGQPVETLIPERLRGEHPRLRAEYLARPTARPMGVGLELLGRRKDGSEFPVDVCLSPSPDPEGLLVTAAIRDVSRRKRLEDELTRTAFYDTLTGLPNRALLMDRLRLAIERASQGESRRFALLCIGLDRFEDITSSLGHNAGDELLVACAERLQQFALAGDTVCHLRDDVFVLLQDRLGGVADATRLADQILSELGREIELAGQEVFAGTSVGIAFSTERSTSAEEILRDAETAMHRARRRGQRSYEIFDDKMHRDATVRLELGMDLQRAVESEQLFLEYQPILSVSTGAIVGAEALVRWRHPKQGLIEPADLIPLAEETGSIIPIGDWVLNRACRENLYWQRERAAPLFVAVNLSAAQLRQRELPAKVRGVLRETGLDPALLHLELTETILVENSDLALDALAALRATGAGLCVDDFGVGHSSLSYLQHLPVGTLKIDRSFVRPMGQEAKCDSLMAAIIGIAHSLELKAIAEGVESKEQLDSLRSLACDEYQGYFYSPPLPEQNFTEMLQGIAES